MFGECWPGWPPFAGPADAESAYVAAFFRDAHQMSSVVRDHPLLGPLQKAVGKYKATLVRSLNPTAADSFARREHNPNYGETRL